MSEQTTLAVDKRERAGKGAARQTRRAGLLPGVIYGGKKAPTMIQFDPRLMIAEMNKPGLWTRLFDIEVDGKTEKTICQDIQMNVVTDKPIHVDFMRVTNKTTVTVNVPIKAINEEKSPGLKRGGVVNWVRHEIEVHCLANEMPHAIEVDFDGLDLNDSIHVSSVKLPKGVEPTITDRDFTIATIGAPSSVRSEASEASDAAEGDEVAEGEEE